MVKGSFIGLALGTLSSLICFLAGISKIWEHFEWITLLRNYSITGRRKILAVMRSEVRWWRWGGLAREGETCVGDIQYSCLHANQYEEAIYSRNLL